MTAGQPNFLFKLIALLTGAALIGGGLFFAFQDIGGLQHKVVEILSYASGTKWAFPFVCLLYLLSSAVMFPVIVLNLATALVFGVARGFFYALSGMLLSATVFFFIGRFGRSHGLRKFLGGPRVRRIDARLRNAGLVGVATLRLVPVAPFGVFNLAAGVTSLRFADYLLGTLIAFLPGGIARAVVGKSIVDLFLHPSRETALYLAGGVILWAGMVAALQFGVRKLRPRDALPQF